MAALATWNRRSFEGNPYVNITAINTAGGILTSRTSGETPFHFSASASAITGTGTSAPYKDIEYRWTLEREDGSGGWEAVTDSEEIYSPVSAAAYNTYTDQTKPEAAFCIRSEHLRGGAQTDFRLTLTCRAWNGSGYVTETVTETITVDPYSGTTYYYDPTGGSDSNDGLAETDEGGGVGPWQTGAKLISELADNTQHLIKSGETLTTASAIFVQSYDGLRIGNYGGAANAIIQAASGITLETGLLSMSMAGAGTPYDHVYSNITFDGNDLVHSVVDFYGGAAGDVQAIYWNNCTFTNTGATNNRTPIYIAMNSTTKVGIGFWKCTVSTTNQTGGQGIHLDTANGSTHPDWVFAMATHVEGDGSNTTEHHHYYIKQGEHTLLRCLTFGASTGRNYCINLDKPIDTGTDYKWVVIDECAFDLDTGIKNGIDVSSNNTGQSNSEILDVVIQHNAFFGDPTNTASTAIQFYNGDLVVRDNTFRSLGGGFISQGDETSPLYVYANLFYTPSSDTGNASKVFFNEANIVANRFSHNVIHDDTSDAEVLRMAWTKHGTGDIDYNQYYTPSDTTVFYDDDANFRKNFADWQASGFDPNSINGVDPNFADPANGDFTGYTFPESVDPSEGVASGGLDSAVAALHLQNLAIARGLV